MKHLAIVLFAVLLFAGCFCSTKDQTPVISKTDSITLKKVDTVKVVCPKDSVKIDSIKVNTIKKK